MLSENQGATYKSLFEEIKVTQKDSLDVTELKDSRELSIILTSYIDPKTLPYAEQEQLGEVYLSSIGAKRFNNCMVVARGDTRSPQEIFDSGGFHPKFTAPGSVQKNEIKDVLDIVSHRGATEGSGLVSYTNAPSIARCFGSDEGGYFYLAKATGAVGPSNQDFYKHEKEYSVPGGIDAEDIIAIRKVKKGSEGEFEGSLLINKAFIKKYPDKVPAVIEACLRLHEVPVLGEITGLDSNKVKTEIEALRAKNLEEAKEAAKLEKKHSEKIKIAPQTKTGPNNSIEDGFNLLKKLIEQNALKMQPTSMLSRGLYSAKTYISSSSSTNESKQVSKSALTIQTIYSLCGDKVDPKEKLVQLANKIQKKVQELQLKKINGELYPGCHRSSELSLEDLTGNMANQYKFIVAVHLALQKSPEHFYTSLRENFKLINSFDINIMDSKERKLDPIMKMLK